MTSRFIRCARRPLAGLRTRAARLPRARALDVPRLHRLGAGLAPALPPPGTEHDRLASGWLAIDALETAQPRRLHPIDQMYEYALACKRDAVRGAGFLLSLAAILWIVA